MLGLGSYRVVDRAGGLGYSLLGHLVLALAVGGSKGEKDSDLRVRFWVVAP